ncbi:MAG: flavodoxin-dependent (E)-4-hydroxy-3-methylbut-2-enyl-diphosphate synthase [Oscillospiraceae bacterium]|jgi:(E)-4-hydroxy-3-methylbut-2-enyl-diphosphate synthase|nr:flavodoxin-dependent (E)-4-hydroxy-3-methylbut-2-enyl-diphosphate synthase [Oscillospiraceae bacterium]
MLSQKETHLPLRRAVKVGALQIGGGAPVSVQSMLSIRAEDVPGNIVQAKALEAAGCELLRAACPDKATIQLFAALKENLRIPVVADIHFDYRLALECAAVGVDKIRINPGNIGASDRVKAVADACRQKQIPIRIGVNGGSLEKEILAKYGSPNPEAMCESALGHIRLLEQYDFTDIVVSLKSSHPAATVAAYRLLAQACDYPLHLGLTEAGTVRLGILKSAAAIGSLLLDGLGDTIRVSLTADPIEEVRTAINLLRALELRRTGPVVISCPTCGRTRIDLISLASQVEEALLPCTKPITVAVMGCAVNGPGEAREADIGLAGGIGECLLFKKGTPLYKVPEAEALSALLREIESL